MTDTPLDASHAAMEAAPDDPYTRLDFYHRLAATEIFLLLDGDPKGKDGTPRIFETSEGRFVLAFDREDRLAEFAQGPAPYAALPGRGLARMLAGQSIGIGLNLGVARSSMLLPDSAVSWLSAILDEAPAELTATPAELFPPAAMSERLIGSIDASLARVSGLAAHACLAGVQYDDGRRGNLLAFVGPVPGAEGALSRAIAEAVIFADDHTANLDLIFLAPTSPLAQRLEAVGLRFDLPEAENETPPSLPGSDPSRPPRLRRSGPA